MAGASGWSGGDGARSPERLTTDRWSRSKAVEAPGASLYLLVANPWQLAVVRVYHGFATAIFGPVALALVSLSSAFVAAIPTAVTFVVLLAIGIVYGLGLSVVTSSTSAYVSELAKAGSYGSALGVLSTIMDIGQSTGPMVTGLLVAGLGYEPAFLVVAALLLVGASGFWLLAPRPKASLQPTCSGPSEASAAKV